MANLSYADYLKKQAVSPVYSPGAGYNFMDSFSQPGYSNMRDWGSGSLQATTPAWDSKYTNPVSMATAGDGPVSSPSIWDSMLGKKDAPGWGGLAVGAAGGLANAYFSMKNYGLAKDSFEEGKRQFAVNYAAQKQTTNNDMRLQAERRYGERPGQYSNADDYMKQHGIA